MVNWFFFKFWFNNKSTVFSLSLIKDHEARASLDELMKHGFIEKYLNENIDANFVENIIEKTKADLNEEISWFSCSF